MILVIDTNVVSELMKSTPDEHVVRYVNYQDIKSVFVTAVTIAEVRYGIALLPHGRRRERLRVAANEFFELMNNRVLGFTAASACEYGDLAATRTALGRPIGPLDAMIAAICLEVGATLATRNTKDFTDTGVQVVDPWTPLN